MHASATRHHKSNQTAKARHLGQALKIPTSLKHLQPLTSKPHAITSLEIRTRELHWMGFCTRCASLRALGTDLPREMRKGWWVELTINGGWQDTCGHGAGVLDSGALVRTQRSSGQTSRLQHTHVLTQRWVDVRVVTAKLNHYLALCARFAEPPHGSAVTHRFVYSNHINATQLWLHINSTKPSPANTRFA